MNIDRIRWFVERILEYALVSFSSWDNFTSALMKIPNVIADLKSGMAWPYLIASMLISYGMFQLSKRRGADPDQPFHKFLFPGHIYQHPSAILDYGFYAASIILKVLVIGPIVLGIALAGYKVTQAVSTWLSWTQPTTIEPSYLLAAVFGLFLLADFVNYVSHYLFHKIPALWSFHAVHHSAEVLTPITARRFHPVEYLVSSVLQAPVAGMTTFLYQGLSAQDRQITLIFGVSLFTFVFGLSGRHLRHSHIWLSYGPVLSWLLVSPAQHQIHHSVESRHRDRNFGDRFALWDGLFGTLYVPKEREVFNVGLPEGSPERFSTVRQLYILPFRHAWRKCLGSLLKHVPHTLLPNRSGFL